MELIPHDEIKLSNQWNFAPMIDFLFLMLALFATLAISRAALYDTDIELTQLKKESKSLPSQSKQLHQIHLSINQEGTYHWMTELQKYPMSTPQAIQEELAKQHQMNILPENKEETEILLHIDQKAPWDAVVKVIFAIREIGFEARPVYDASR